VVRRYRRWLCKGALVQEALAGRAGKAACQQLFGGNFALL
jgi:hypothetical protein